MRKFILAVFFVLFVSTAASTTIQHENVTVDLRESSVSADIQVEDLTSSSFSYITSYPVGDVDVEIAGSEVPCEVQSLQVGSDISCETSLRKNFTVSMDFKGEGFVTENPGFSTFNYQHSVYRPTDHYQLMVILPEGTGVLRESNSSSTVVSPQDHDKGTLSGRTFFVKWDANPQLGETLTFEASYETLSEQQDYSGILLGAIGTLIAISLCYLGWRMYIQEPIESVYGEIDEDEKDVLELIQQNDGQMLQKDIVKESDYSKAKISGVVKGLVEKGVLKKEKEGRSNRLKIPKKYQG